MLTLPTGTVTFLLTDVEGSTGLWEQEPEATLAALAPAHGWCAQPARPPADAARCHCLEL